MDGKVAEVGYQGPAQAVSRGFKAQTGKAFAYVLFGSRPVGQCNAAACAGVEHAPGRVLYKIVSDLCLAVNVAVGEPVAFFVVKRPHRLGLHVVADAMFAAAQEYLWLADGPAEAEQDNNRGEDLFFHATCVFLIAAAAAAVDSIMRCAVVVSTALPINFFCLSCAPSSM